MDFENSGNKKRQLIIITTGGTIEKTYDENDGLLINRKSVVDEKIIPRMRLPYTEVDVRPVLSKDSLYMDEEDRKKLSYVIQQFQTEGHPIIVLHGTDTMDKSLQYCYAAIPDIKVPVIFTGAMKPLGFEDSDAFQNIVEAMFAAMNMGAGFYLSFHNRLFHGPHFRKNRKLGTFEYSTNSVDQSPL